MKNIEDKIPDITNLSTNTTLNAKTGEVKSELTSITNQPTNASFNAKVNEVKGEIPSITNLVTTAALITFENEISNVVDLVKKANQHAQIKDIKDRYFTTSDYNNFKNNILDEKMTAKNLVNDSVSNEKLKRLAAKEEIKKLPTAAELKAQQDKIVNLQTYDLSLFISQSCFANNGAQLYLIFQALYYTSLLYRHQLILKELYHGNLEVCQPKNF